MKEEIPFKKKLAGYSALSGALVASAFSTDAQILYTDVIPDDTLTAAQSSFLDLNNDGVVDFYLVVAHQPFGYATGDIVGNNLTSAVNSVAGIAIFSNTSTSYTGGAMKLPFRLWQEDVIDSNLEWVKPKAGSDLFFGAAYEQAILNAVFFSYTFYGNWQNGVENGYVGLRINLNGDQLYGWVRLDVDSAAKWMIVKDYAINLTPNHPILAGQCLCPATGIPEASDAGNIIFPNPASTRIFISGLNENLNEAEVSVFDLSGRKMFAQKVSSIQNEIDVSSLNDGIYFLELKNRDQSLVEKFEVRK